MAPPGKYYNLFNSRIFAKEACGDSAGMKSLDDYTEVYNAPRVITLDELPW